MARKSTYEELEQRIREFEKESAKRRQAEEKLRERRNIGPSWKTWRKGTGRLTFSETLRFSMIPYANFLVIHVMNCLG